MQRVQQRYLAVMQVECGSLSCVLVIVIESGSGAGMFPVPATASITSCVSLVIIGISLGTFCACLLWNGSHLTGGVSASYLSTTFMAFHYMTLSYCGARGETLPAVPLWQLCMLRGVVRAQPNFAACRTLTLHCCLAHSCGQVLHSNLNMLYCVAFAGC